VEATQSEASKKMLRCSDAHQLSGASAVVVQKLIQRGKDKCRLIEPPEERASKEVLPNDVRYPPVSSSCSSWTSQATRYRIYQHVSSRRAPTCSTNLFHTDKQWLLVKSWQNGLSPDVWEVRRETLAWVGNLRYLILSPHTRAAACSENTKRSLLGSGMPGMWAGCADHWTGVQVRLWPA